ncbi:hypothetical protein ACODH8_02970 [Vagococcus fluvialis]
MIAMLNLSDKRQHFRFPAYDDEIGVKLVKNNKREFLKDILDDGFVYKKQESNLGSRKKNEINKIKTLNIDPIDMVDEPDYFGYTEKNTPVQEEIKAIPRERTAVFLQKEVKVDQERKTLNNHTYVETSSKEYVSPQSTFSNNLVETDTYGNAKYNKVDRKRSKFESSYNLPGAKGSGMFKPKHIPASLIDDSNERPRHSRDVIVDELRKVSSGGLLLLEDDVILDPIIDQVEMISEENTESIGTFPEKKKNQRLEKTLSGIIADEGSSGLDSNYFD